MINSEGLNGSSSRISFAASDEIRIAVSGFASEVAIKYAAQPRYCNRGYSAALLGDHVPNGWEVFTHEPNRYAQALAEIAYRWDGSLIEGGFCRSFQIRSVLRHVISAPSRK